MDKATAELRAISTWIQAGFPNVRRKPSSAPDYADGTVFADILLSIDPEIFGEALKPIEPVPAGSPWSMRLSNLKKILKSINDYMLNVLVVDATFHQQAVAPNLTAIAKDEEVGETLRLARWLVYLAAKCPKASETIQVVMQLDHKVQALIMASIQTMMDEFENGKPSSVTPNGSSGASPAATAKPSSAAEMDYATKLTALLAEKQSLENTVKSLGKQLDSFRQQQDETTAESFALKERIKELEMVVEKHSSKAGQSEVAVKTEMESLRRQLHESEEKRLEIEHFVENQQLLVNDLQRKVDDLTQKAAEADRLRDSLDEFKHVAERLEKSEQMLEKYKKKAEELTELRKRIKELEEQNSKQAADYAALEDEYRKLGSNRPLMDKFKDQMAQMEARNAELTANSQRLEMDLKSAHAERDSLSSQRTRDQEHIAALEEKLHELELLQDGGGVGSTAAAGLYAELSDGLSAPAVADLKLQISRLQQENGRLQTASESAETVKHELEVERAKVMALRQQLTDRTTATAGNNSAELERMAVLETEQKRQLESINRLLTEKDQLQKELLTTKDLLLKQERSNADLKQSLALQEVKDQSNLATADGNKAKLEENLAAASAKIIEQTDQLRTLQQALKKAKDHIIGQDQQLKELKSQAAINKSSVALQETLEPLQDLLKARDMELTRLKTEMEELRQRTRAEQKLIMSAWYDLGLQLHRRSGNANSGAGTGNSRFGSPGTGGTPSSWLGQQRKSILDTPIKSRR